MNLHHEHKEIIWKSRRGMLEIDFFLDPFVKYHYPNLSCVEKRSYRKFLEFDDVVIWAWLQGIEKPTDADMVDLVKIIRAIHL